MNRGSRVTRRAYAAASGSTSASPSRWVRFGSTLCAARTRVGRGSDAGRVRPGGGGKRERSGAERDSGRWPGGAALPPDQVPRQAGRADRRQVPADRRADQQLPARRLRPDLRAHPVQLGLAAPPHQAHLLVRQLLRRLRRHPGRRADHDQRELVPGHGRRRPPAAARAAARSAEPGAGALGRSPAPHGLSRIRGRAPRSQGGPVDRRQGGGPCGRPGARYPQARPGRACGAIP